MSANSATCLQRVGKPFPICSKKPASASLPSRPYAHLKSPDFFDVATYPAITFKSKKVEQEAQGKINVTGDFTIHGVTREVVLVVDGPPPPIRDPWGNSRAAIDATTKVNRQDFGVKWNANLDGGGVVVDDDVNIAIDVVMIKQVPAKSGN